MAATIPIFDGDNYQFWKVKMKTLFLSMDLWDTVENGYDDETDPDGQKQRKNAAALSQIQQGVSDRIFPRIMNATKAKQAWDILQTQFQRDGMRTRPNCWTELQCPANISKSKDTHLIVATLIATVTFSAVLIHLSNMADDDPNVQRTELGLAFTYTGIALIAMLLAFITGTYAVLAPSGLSIAVCMTVAKLISSLELINIYVKGFSGSHNWRRLWK